MGIDVAEYFVRIEWLKLELGICPCKPYTYTESLLLHRCRLLGREYRTGGRASPPYCQAPSYDQSYYVTVACPYLTD